MLAGALIAAGCSSTDTEPPTVALHEPSGMSASSTAGEVWVVSDAGPDIALIDATGSTIRTISVALSDTDWEGIVELSNGNLLVAEERRLELVEIDPNTGDVVRVSSLAGMDGYAEIAQAVSGSSANKGLEGITVDESGSIWIVKESDPALLIELNAALTTIESWIDPSPALADHLGIDAEDIDLSGLAPHADPDKLWILSHNASTSFVWNTATSTVEQSYHLGIDKGEGIAAYGGNVMVVDENSGELVVVDTP